MALTPIQRDVCRLLASERRRSGDSYIAGGVALSAALQTTRLSRDIDVFHDTEAAVTRSWERDRFTLEAAGYVIRPLRERSAYVEAAVSREGQELIMEWAGDSAFRFFPLVEDDALGLALHPFDLATNKTLALVGRAEVRDWIDVVACHERLQPLGYLAWASCAKDPGFTPAGIVEQAARSSRYTDEEIAPLAFEGTPPAAADLSRRWHGALEEARHIVAMLPVRHVGEAVITTQGELFTGAVDDLERVLRGNLLQFHRGRIGGAWPRVKG
jgi:hypothetical protein